MGFLVNVKLLVGVVH